MGSQLDETEKFKFTNVKNVGSNLEVIIMTNICRNPNCEKEIPNSMNYCSEDCLREHIKIKEQNRKEKETNTVIPSLLTISKEGRQEIENICEMFGFRHTDGLVSGSHNATILGYLYQHKEEIYSKTVDKLTWICHMSNRSVRENYLKGIEAFGIIETFTNEFGVIKWRWIGIKALKNNGGE